MKNIIVIVAALLLSACGSYQAATQAEPGTYIQFVGEPHKGDLTIDGKAVGSIEQFESFDLNGQTVTRIKINPGTHNILINRNGSLIVNRKIYVSDGNIFEVQLP